MKNNINEMCKRAKDRIKNGEFLKTLQEEKIPVDNFIKFLQNKRRFKPNKMTRIYNERI